MIEAEDYEKVSKYKWCYSSSNGYAVSRRRVNGKKEVLLLHRYIMNPKEGNHIDHINMDKLDNRKSNLRECSPSDNFANVGAHSNNKSGYKGVYWVERLNKYQVTIRKNNTTFYVGVFDSIEEAIRIYDFWIIHIRGEFANPNRFKYSDIISYGGISEGGMAA